MSEAVFDLQDFIVKDLPPEVYYVPNYISEECEKALISSIYNVSPNKWTQLSHRRLQNWGGTPHIKGMVEEKLPLWLSEQCSRLAKLGLYNGTLPNHVLVNEYLPGQGIMPHTDGPLYFPTVSIISLASNLLLDFYKPYHSQDTSNNSFNNSNNNNNNNNNNISNNNNNPRIPNANHNNTDERDVMDKNIDISVYPQMDDTQGTIPKMADRRLGSLYLERRSLLIFRSDAYTKYLHGIQDTTSDHIDDKVLNLSADLYGADLKREEPRVSMTIRVVPKTIKASKIFGKIK